jgi:hypothetical protein
MWERGTKLEKEMLRCCDPQSTTTRKQKKGGVHMLAYASHGKVNASEKVRWIRKTTTKRKSTPSLSLIGRLATHQTLSSSSLASPTNNPTPGDLPCIHLCKVGRPHFPILYIRFCEGVLCRVKGEEICQTESFRVNV